MINRAQLPATGTAIALNSLLPVNILDFSSLSSQIPSSFHQTHARCDPARPDINNARPRELRFLYSRYKIPVIPIERSYRILWWNDRGLWKGPAQISQSIWSLGRPRSLSGRQQAAYCEEFIFGCAVRCLGLQVRSSPVFLMLTTPLCCWL